jgi:hypothetical protein
MTKWICKGCWCRRCYVDDPNDRIVPNQCPDKGIINPCWERDCTEEKKIDIEEMDERTARFRAYISKRLDALEKKDQELERQVKALHSHRHETMVAHYER